MWNLTNAGKTVKSFDGFDTVNEFSAAKVFSTPTFHPNGHFLAFPKSGSSIHVLDTATWETKFKLSNTALTGKLSVCSFSCCGQWIAAGSTNGEISVWDFNDKSRLKGQHESEDTHAITTLAWNPKNNGELAFCDNDGQLSAITVTAESGGNFLADEAVEDANDFYGTLEFHDNASDDDNENCVSLDKLKNETLKKEESDDDNESINSQSTSHMAPSARLPLVKPFQTQPPFQPGSTPSTLEHRFMVWNHVGQVLCHSTDENSIIAEFHDVTIHPSLHILNSLNHEMASLSTTCLALASKDTPCRLVVIAFVSSGSKEWSTTMPECELIQNLAAGENFVAVATDAGFIRFFTTMGTQREVVAVSGPVVALAAWENNLAVVYHTSTTRNRYSLMIYTLRGPSMTAREVALPLTAGTKLMWLGFSDMGSVIAYDSSGRVSSYNVKRNVWYPICDLTCHIVGASDKFFIVSVSESGQKIRASLCRGTSYPLTSPRPIVREIDYALPLCYMENEKSQLEDTLVRAQNFNMDSSEKVIVEKGLKLFSAALNSELESRAFEILELIGDKRLIVLASRYSSQKGRMHMANKISKLLMEFDEREKKREALMNEIGEEVELFSETFEMQTPKAVEKRIQETSTPLIAPKPITKQKLNPFKKSGSNKSKSATSCSLTHLTNKSIGYNQNTTEGDDENVSTNNLSTVSSNVSTAMDTPRPGSFGTWFIANKSDLKVSHPDSSDAELMKIGKDLYKELTKKTKVPDDLTNSTTLNKRKLNLNEDESGGIAKLAKYGFTQD